MIRLGVCIVTRSSEEVVLSCLNSLLEQPNHPEWEIVVVDNDSDDNTVNEIRKKFPLVKIIENTGNLGFSRAVNQGLKTLDAQYYVLLNPDAIVQEGALDGVIRFMNENSRAGICIPKVLNSDGTLQYQCRRGEARPWEVFSYFLGLAKLFPNDTRFTGYLLNHIDNEKITEVKAVSGSCMVIRREVIQEIGYLDERYFAYQEDSDYCFQARKADWKVYYVPTGTVIHLGGRGGSRENPYFGIYHWHLSYYLYYKKNLAIDYPFWFHPIYYFLMLIKFMLNILGVFLGRNKLVGTPKPA